MSIKISFNGATLYRPGAYSKTSVNLIGGMPLSDTGIVAIVGEAEKGSPGDDSTFGGVAEFTSEQLPALIDAYGSGPIVEAARMLVQPARDNRIPNGAQKILVWKTNSSVKSSLDVQGMDDVSVNILAFSSANWGSSENLLNLYIADGSDSSDENSVLLSSEAVTFPVAVANNDTLIIDVNGTNYTLTVATAPGASVSMSQAQWVTLLNGVAVTVGADTATPTWVTVKPCVFAASGSDKISATLDETQAPFDKYENMFEYGVMSVETSNIGTSMKFTGVSAIDASTLVITDGGAGPVIGSRGGRIFIINRGSSTETSDENDNEVNLTVRYIGSGSACSLSVSGASDSVKVLETTCTAAASDDLSITLSEYTTVEDLVTYINNFGGGAKYTCVSSYSKKSSRASTSLDRYDAIDIKTLPVGLKCALYEIEDIIDSASELVSVERGAFYGQVELIASTAKEFFTGASKGASVNSDFTSGLDAFLGKKVNIVIPLVSQNASVDVTDGLTDSGSTYEIDSVNAAVDTHCRLASNTKNRNERQAYISYKASFALSRAAAKSMASEFCTMAFQNVDVLNTSGTLETKQPWALACLAGGMQAGSRIGEPTTYKYANAYGISHSDFDEVTDVAQAIDDGLLVIEKPSSGGYRIVCQNTSYGKDASFVYNRAHVIEAAFYVSYDMRKQLEDIYIGSGRSRASSMVKSIYTTSVSLLGQYLDAGIIVGDATNNNLGFKDLTVSISGSVVSVDVTITPVQGVDFILNNITLDNIRDSIG